MSNPFYSLVPQPDFGPTKLSRKNKRYTYQSASGYRHVRPSSPRGRKVFQLGWKQLQQGDINTILEFMDIIGSDIFDLVDPTSLAPDESGTINPQTYAVRLVEDSFDWQPVTFDGEQTRYKASLLFEEV